VNYAVVGAFVLVLGAVLVGIVLWIASGGALAKKYDLYMAIEDESVAGLNLNAPVKYNGVDVGKVRDIHLDPANAGRVRLTFAIEHGTPIKVDTVAVLKTQGLTGIAYVELSGGAQDAALLPPSDGEPYPVIRTKPSLAARLENVLTTVLAKLDRTSSNIDAVLSAENRAALASTLADLAAVSHTLAARKNTIDAGITSAARTLDSAARTFDNASRVTAQLGPVVERISRGAEAVEKMGDDVSAASTRVGGTIAAAGGDARRFMAQTLPEVQRVLGELNVLSASLRRLSEQTERNPASLLFGRNPLPEGPGEATPGGRQP
jgi:phospholipid/cholesterol/gamma-HCH transport system substrate-binding protein